MLKSVINEKQILVSIIVPVYNAEEYLDQCMKTLLNQTYENIEIILVDDGSTDLSGKKCDEYAFIDRRIKVYHQRNGGQAAARNFAFSMASGDYILYVDSDDYISLNQVEKLLSISIEYDADIVQCYYTKFGNKIKRTKVKETGKVIEYTASKALEEFCYQGKISPSPWGKLIRRDVMVDVCFPTGIGYEDMAVMYVILGKTKKIVLLPEILYFYRQHHASTMHIAFSDKKIDRIRIAEELKNYIDTYFPENSKAVKTRYLLANFQLLMDLPYGRKYKNLRKTINYNIKRVRFEVLKDRQSKFSIKLMILASYLGIATLMCLGRLYKRFVSEAL